MYRSDHKSFVAHLVWVSKRRPIFPSRHVEKHVRTRGAVLAGAALSDNPCPSSVPQYSTLLIRANGQEQHENREQSPHLGWRTSSVWACEGLSCVACTASMWVKSWW